MTFTEIVNEVADRLNLTSSDATTRIGRRVNRRYRRVRVAVGMIAVARSSSTVAVTPGTRDQTFNGEKVLSVRISGATRALDFVSYEEMQETIPTTGNPTCWALKSQGATTQLIQFDSTMDSGLDLIVEVESTGSTLVGTDVPAFNEAFHDILIFGALADEYRKKEKLTLARDAESDYDRVLNELKYHIAVNGYQDITQGKRTNTARATTSSGGGGTGNVTASTGVLAATHLVVGKDGVRDVSTLADPGTSVKVLHGNAVGEPTFSAVVEADLGLTDVVIANVSSTKHGLVPKAPAAATQFLNGAATPVFAAVKDSDLATTDVTSNNADSTKHGFAPKLPNDATKFLDGTGVYSKPSDPLKANLASPIFTGDPTAPTPAISDNDTSIATSAYVLAARETVVTLVDGATPALDASLGNLFVLVAAGDRTIAVPTNARAGKKIIIRHLASGGIRTLALNTGAGGFRFGSDITSLTATASGKTDYIGCVYNATDSFWDVVAVTKGF